jgi:hypothetical protein
LLIAGFAITSSADRWACDMRDRPASYIVEVTRGDYTGSDVVDADESRTQIGKPSIE